MIKLALSIAVFLVSLLTILRAPAYFLWLVAIIVDEFPWLPIAITILLLFLNPKTNSFPILSNMLLIGSLCFYVSPVVRAKEIAAHLPHDLDRAFGPTGRAAAFEPFLISRMLTGNKQVTSISAIYKKQDDISLSMEFYPSTMSGNKPVVVVIHGGSWQSGDNQQLPQLNSVLASNGYHVAAINYRLAPTAKSPAQIEDVRDAIAYLKTKKDPWHIDTSRLILLGRSAGAQIALMAAYTLRDPGIKGVIDFYGPADMVWGYSLPSNPLIMDSRKVMEQYLGGTYEKYPQNFELSSPLLHATTQSPPTLIIHGAQDVLVAYEHSRRLNLKLQKLNVRHYLLTLPWATHGFDYNINGPGGQLSTYAVLHFLQTAA